MTITTTITINTNLQLLYSYVSAAQKILSEDQKTLGRSQWRNVCGKQTDPFTFKPTLPYITALHPVCVSVHWNFSWVVLCGIESLSYALLSEAQGFSELL